MTRYTCIVSESRVEAAERLARIWIRMGYQFRIIPPIAIDCVGKLYYMDRDRKKRFGL